MLERLRSSIAAGGRPVNLSLARTAPAEVEQITSWCELLRDCGLLVHYRYDRYMRQLWARPELGAREMLGGAWLERLVTLRLSEQLRELGQDPLVLSNVRIRMANGREGELDVLGWVGDAPVWIECRSGRFTDRLGVYAARRRDLGVDSERALVVVMRAAAQQIRLVRALHRVRIVPLAELETAIVALAESGVDHRAPQPARHIATDPPSAGTGLNEAGRSEDPRNQEIVADGIGGGVDVPGHPQRPRHVVADRSASVFRRVTVGPDQQLVEALAAAGLRPHPELRRRCLEALASHMASGIPMTGPQLMQEVSADAGASEAAVMDVLAALARSGALLDERGEAILSLDATIHALRVRSADELDARCRQVYRATLRANDPTAASGPEGERVFDATVG